MHHGILKLHEDWYKCSSNIKGFCITDLKNCNADIVA
jgi:hypothetical protein